MSPILRFTIIIIIIIIIIYYLFFFERERGAEFGVPDQGSIPQPWLIGMTL